MSKDKHSNKRGPKPETLKVDGDVDWKEAMKHALHKPKPKQGWPKPKGKEGYQDKEEGQQG